VADDADAKLLFSLTKFLTADKYAATNSTAGQTTETLGKIQKTVHVVKCRVNVVFL